MTPLRSLAAIVFLVVASSACAQTVINSVPYTITTSGKYVLGNNFITESASQSAISISAPNVILDLNGFFLSGPGNSPSSNTPVISVGNVSNVTIRNGTVANNAYGISFSPGGNAINEIVEGVNVTRCTFIGVSFPGISSGSAVRNCTFSQIGGATFVPNQSCYGISSAAGGVRIENNSIIGVTAVGNGVSYGISSSGGSFHIGNTISSCDVGISGGKYKDNLFFNCTTLFTGGSDGGGNS